MTGETIYVRTFSKLILIFAIMACGRVVCTGEETTLDSGSEKEYFLFAFFRHGEKAYTDEMRFFSGGAGVYYAWSEDGLEWKEIGTRKHFFTPSIGNTLRDPAIIRGPDNRFHIVWTTGWRERTIGYASSADLVEWEDERLLPVMKHQRGALNCWAPEIFYDHKSEKFLIFWSTTIESLFPETNDPEDSGYNHRIYFTTTEDFRHFSHPELFYDPGFNCIDATILDDGDRYLLFLKDETLSPPAKYLVMAMSTGAMGPYGEASGRISPEDVWVEGPSAIRIDGTYFVYYDMFRDNRYGLIVSKDLVKWEDRTDSLTVPEGAKHGSFIRITGGELEHLREAAREN